MFEVPFVQVKKQYVCVRCTVMVIIIIIIIEVIILTATIIIEYCLDEIGTAQRTAPPAECSCKDSLWHYAAL